MIFIFIDEATNHKLKIKTHLSPPVAEGLEVDVRRVTLKYLSPVSGCISGEPRPSSGQPATSIQ